MKYKEQFGLLLFVRTCSLGIVDAIQSRIYMSDKIDEDLQIWKMDEQWQVWKI